MRKDNKDYNSFLEFFETFIIFTELYILFIFVIDSIVLLYNIIIELVFKILV